MVLQHESLRLVHRVHLSLTVPAIWIVEGAGATLTVYHTDS